MNKYRPILRLLNDAGHQAFFVGGCVRDHLLNRVSKDVDIATSATPEEIASLFSETELVGAHFGVTLVRFGTVEAEVATFRKDGCYSDSRHPDSVEFTDNYVEDVKRRDFTINALYMDVHGHVYDSIQGSSGLDDLRDGIIRCVGNPTDRFREDALRTLRAVGFASRLGFFIQQDTALAIQAAAHTIMAVSQERITEELLKILTSGNAACGIRFLSSLGLLELILPEVAALKGCTQNPQYHPEGDVYVHTLGLLRQLPPNCSRTLALGVLLHDVGKPATRGEKDGQPTFHGHEEAGAKIASSILRRLKVSNEIHDTVVDLVAQHMRFRVAKEMRRGKLLRFLRQPNFAELLELHRMDALAGRRDLTNYVFCQLALDSLPPESLRPARLLTGDDLIAMGFKPGPSFKTVLEALETAQLEGEVTSADEAVEFVKVWKPYTHEVA